MIPDWFFILFLFTFGACIGSFLNVVVWRLPRGVSLTTPPSHCPKCEHRLAWYDNLPVIGWLLLGGKCRYCQMPISLRYPIVEAVTGLLFAFFYVMVFMVHQGPCFLLFDEDGRLLAALRLTNLEEGWPIFGLYLFAIASLLAASLIDAELFIIPIEIPWLMAGVGVLVHAIIDRPAAPGTLTLPAGGAALAAGAGLGLGVSIFAWWRKWIPTSFPQGEPLLEVDREAVERELTEAHQRGENPPPLPPPYTSGQVRREMTKEMLFLLPPMLLGAFFYWIARDANWWKQMCQDDWLTGMLGALMGAMVGAFTVWIVRIIGTLGFGRVAMGLGYVHLMFGVGAIIGAGASVVAFFLAPFFGILVAIYVRLSRSQRELPYGPYLSLASAYVMLFYCPIAVYLQPGIRGVTWMFNKWMGQ